MKPMKAQESDSSTQASASPATSLATPARKSFRLRPENRLARYAFYLGLAVLLWGVLLGLVVPPLAKHFIVKNVKSTFDSRLEIESIRFNPFSFHLTFNKLFLPYPVDSIGLDEDVKYFFSLEKLEARLNVSGSLYRLAPILDVLTLEQPRVDVTLLEDGSFSIREFVRHLPPSPPTHGAVSDKPLFPFILENFDIIDGNLIFRDRLRSSTQQISKLNLSIPFVSTAKKDSERPVTPLLTASMGGRDIRLEGKAFPFAESLRAEFRAVVDDIPLSKVKAYLGMFSSLELESGKFGSDFTLSFEQIISGKGEAGLDIRLKGLLRLEDISLTAPRISLDKPGPQVFALNKGELAMELVDISEGLVRIHRLDFNAPVLRATYNKNGTLDWQSFLQPLPVIASKSGQLSPAPQVAVPIQSGEATVDQSKSSVTATSNATQAAPVQSVSGQNVSGQNATLQNTPSQNITASANSTPAPQDARSTPRHLIFFLSKLELLNGQLQLRDESVPGGQELQLSGLEAHLVNMDSTSRLENFSLSGQAGGNSAFSMEGMINFQKLNQDTGLPAEFDSKSKLTLKNLPLTQLNPRLKKMFPIELKDGLLGGEADVLMSLSLENSKKTQISLQNGALRVTGLSVAPSGVNTPFFILGGLELSGVKADVGQRAVSIAALKISKPNLSVRRDASGQFDMLKLLGMANGGQATSNGAGGTGGANSWNWSLAQLNLDNGQLSLLDEGSGGRNTVSQLNLAASGLSSKTGSKMDVKASLNWDASAGNLAGTSSATASAKPSGGAVGASGNAGSGSLNLAGQVGLSPWSVALSLNMKRLPLSGLSPFMSGLGTARIARGVLQAKIKVQAGAPKSAGAQPDVNISGDFGVFGLNIVDSGKGKGVELISFGRGTVQTVTFNLSPLLLKTGPITLNSPKVNFIVDRHGQNNIAAAFGVSSASETDGTPATAKRPPTSKENSDGKPTKPTQAFQRFSIAKVEVNNGRVNLKDERVSPSAQMTVSSLNVKVEKLSGRKGSQSPFTLDSQLDGAPLDMQGTISPLSALPGCDLQVNLKGFDLVPLAGYFEQGLGYPLYSGTLNSRSLVKLAENKLDMSLGLEIANFDFGNRIPGNTAPEVPLKLAVAMLTDLSGNISLTLPISGRLDDPQFRSGGIVMKTLANLLIKIVASPITLVGNVFGGLVGGVGSLVSSSGSQDLQFLPFAPGEARLSPEGKKIAEAVVKVMQNKPRLSIRLQGCSDASEKKALVEARILAKMRKLKFDAMPYQERKGKSPDDMEFERDKNAQEYEKLLFEVYADEPFDKPGTLGFAKKVDVEEMWRRIYEGTKIEDNDLRDLAMARARNVRQHLIDIDKGMIPRTNLADLLYAKTPKPGEAGFNRVNLLP